uniref:Hexosyltransferase n=1 Tax=Romanomermis culicivorax TaxID=13658 RepID=A0A915IDY4_ROMCU
MGFSGWVNFLLITTKLNPLRNRLLIWRLDAKLERALKTVEQQSAFRPLGFAFIGVLSAERHLNSRVEAIKSTWAGKLPKDFSLAVFIGDAETAPRLDRIPLIKLKNVEDTFYPPQKKSFLMLKYIFDNFLNDFEFFVRADDDVYIRLEKLELFLKSLNSSMPLYLGQPGQGTPEEYGKLDLENNENFCMGGTAVIMSRPVLKKIGPHIKECLANLRTHHEDVEMQTLFRNDINISSQNYDLHNAITLHPAKKVQKMNSLHVLAKRLKAAHLRYRFAQFERDSSTCSKYLAVSDGDISMPSIHRSDIHVWEFLSPYVTFCADSAYCPRKNTESYVRLAINTVAKQVMEISNGKAPQTERWLSFRHILYAYKRFDLVGGAEYLLDILLYYKGIGTKRSKLLPARRHVYVKQNFAPSMLIDENTLKIGNGSNSQNSLVNFILALNGDKLKSFKRFIRNFLKIKLKNDVNISLFVVAAGDNDELISLLVNLKTKYDTFIDFTQTGHRGAFNRGQSLNLGASKFSDEDLLFFIDSDIIFDQHSLIRIRSNVVKSRQVYFPIVFSEYKSDFWDSSSKLISYDRRGYFRHYGFGMMGIFKLDFDKVGGFENNIRGWGLEDVKFVEKILQLGHYDILRTLEPSLIHVYHEMTCDKEILPSKQHKMCLDSKLNGLAHVSILFDRFAGNFTGFL